MQPAPKPDPTLLDPSTPIAGIPDTKVCDFWQWAYSDILSNRNRSIFAEFLVASALAVTAKPREEWASFDLEYGKLRIEVKSSAYIQSWGSDGRESKPNFSIRKARFWDKTANEYQGDPTRCSDVYVFCLYSGKDAIQTNVLNVEKWEFYVLGTSQLNERYSETQSLSLTTLRSIVEPCPWSGLKAAVDTLAAE
jgi:hypothetical protein